MKNNIKKHYIWIIALSIFANFSFAQSADVPKQVQNEDAFSKTFLRVVQSANEKFKNITHEETFKDGFQTYQKISVDFPGALWAGYRYNFNMSTYESVYTVTVQYYEGSSSTEAQRIFARLQKNLKTCLGQNSGGRWKIVKDDNENLKAENQDIDGLEVQTDIFLDVVKLVFRYVR